MARIIDLSHSMESGMPVFPGSLPVCFAHTAHLETHGFSETHLSLPSHAGTHMDAPAHMVSGGLSLDRFEPDRFVGPACVLTPDVKNRIEVSALMPERSRIESAEIILIHTGWSRFWGNERYFYDYPALSVDAASWLADFSPKIIGMDTPSVDACDAENYPNHHIFFKKNILLIENLCRLDKLPDSRVTLICLPLLLLNADGSPARAIAMV